MSSLYYPACSVSLYLRFDADFTRQPIPAGIEVDDRTYAQPGSPPGAVLPATPAGTYQPPGIGAANASYGAPGQAPNVTAHFDNANPEFLFSGIPDDLTVVTGRIPMTAEVEESTYRHAGTFKLSFQWKDIPVDPMLVRACAVEIHLDTVSSADFASGMLGTAPDGTRLSQLHPTPATSPHSLRMTGLVDDWESEHGKDGDTVSISGRDLRCIFLDTPIRPGMLAQLKASQPIDVLIRQIIATHPWGSLFTVEVADPAAWPGGRIPASGALQSLTRVRRGPSGAGATQNPGADVHDLSYWDLISNYCQYCAAVPYIQASPLNGHPTIQIRPVTMLFDRMAQQGTNPYDPPPFAGGVPRVAIGATVPFTWRWMVYGRNIEKIKFKRKLSGEKPKIVEVRSVDTSSAQRGNAKLLVARYPETKSNAVKAPGVPTVPIPGVTGQPPAPAPQSVAQNAKNEIALAKVRTPPPSGKKDQSQNEVSVYSFPGIRDPAQLQAIAQAIFTEIAHGELVGTCETKDLASYGGGNNDPDMLRMKVGDTITFDADARELNSIAPASSQINSAQRLSDSALVEEITQRTGDPRLAKIVVASSKVGIMKVQPTFRVMSYRWSWQKGGLQISFDFQEYIVVGNQTLPHGLVPQTKPVVGTT